MTPEPLPFPARPEDRLRLALRSLEAALAEQASAVAQFRASIGALGGAVSELERGMVTFRGELTGLALDVAEAGEQARRLERTADIWLQDGRPS
jgi:carbohydrate-selective porin OprB